MKFGNWKDRVTFLFAEAQFLVAGLLFSIGAAIVLFRPSLPRMPPIFVGWFAATLLFGPPLFGFFVWMVKALRTRNMIEVYHINGVTDTREKYYVAPEIWSEKTVEGPSPYRCNDESAFEVREFDYLSDIDELRVRGCYMSQMADSKLVTVKAMLEDVHGDLVDAFLEYNRLRGRISKMGLEIQRDVVNEEAEADERGMMNPRTSVSDRFDAAKKDAENASDDEIQDVTEHVEDYAESHGIETVSGPPAAPEQARTDGGTDR